MRVFQAALGAAVVVALVVMVQAQRASEARVTSLTRAVEQLAKQVVTTPGPTVTLSAPPPPVDADAIAARVAHRLHDADAQPTTTSAPPPPAQPVAVPAAAQPILTHAIGRGQLAAADVRELRAQLTSASPEERLEVARQIAVALNTGKLVPEDPRFVFP
jgi:hypothetical protein